MRSQSDHEARERSRADSLVVAYDISAWAQERIVGQRGAKAPAQLIIIIVVVVFAWPETSAAAPLLSTLCAISESPHSM